MSLAIANLSWGHPLPGGGWRQLFDGFNLSCQSGQFVVVIGNNGSGKSTLLNLIAGTLKLGGGTITLGERPLHRYRDHRRARWLGRVPVVEQVRLNASGPEQQQRQQARGF